MQYHRRTVWLSGTALLCLALAACNKSPQGTEPVSGAPVAALQLATAPPPPPTYAPPASALPPAPRTVAYQPRPEHWRYLSDAYGMSDAFADTPPDYTVPYDGEDPYVWRADDGAYRVVEWLPDGARYYYYEPGADDPFLIQDPDYSYAYDNGVLVAVYTPAGALVADRIAAEREGYAARYYARGHDLYRAAVNDQRRAAYAANWQQRAPMIQAQRTRWQRGREEQPGWRDWNRAHQAQQDARWAPERQHRATYAAALGAAGVAGAAIVMHHRDQQATQRAAETRPTAPAPINDRNNVRGNHPDAAEQHAEANRAQQGLPHDTTPPPRAHGPQPGMANRHAPEANHAPSQPQAAPTEARGPQNRIAARQAMAQAALAQHRGIKQAQQTRQHEQQQARQAQHHEVQQATHAQHSQVKAQEQQAQQAARQGQRPKLHVEAPRPQPQHAEAPHPQAAHPAPQQQRQQQPNSGGKQDDRHHH
jgi:hypothetical protein